MSFQFLSGTIQIFLIIREHLAAASGGAGSEQTEFLQLTTRFVMIADNKAS
jgi:hypothetical protein